MKILVIRPGAMGDVCLALPLVRALAVEHDVSWLIRRHYVPLVECFPDVGATLIPTDLDTSIVPRLRHERFDVLIDLSHWPEVTRLVNELREVPIRAITFDPDQDERLGVNRARIDLYAPYNHRIPIDAGSHQVERWARLLSSLPLTQYSQGCLAVGQDSDPVISYDRIGILSHGKTTKIFIHPHAGKPSKLWPIHRYVSVLTNIARRHPLECWINSGNRPEWLRAIHLWARLRLHGVRAHILPRDRTYRRLVATLPTMHLALGSDSGPMHFAALLGVPTVVLFGPYPASEFRPPWRSRPVNPAYPGAEAHTIRTADVQQALDETLAVSHAA